jgi:hypothetical protein
MHSRPEPDIDGSHARSCRNEGNWLLQAAEERLRRFDIPDSEIARIEQRGTVEREAPVQLPASGYIIERNALPNA